MKKYCLFIFTSFILIVACQHANEMKHDLVIRKNIYDSMEAKNLQFLNSLHLLKYDDSARWLLYTIHCDDTSIQENSRFMPVCSLNLKLDFLSKESDTLNLLYSFMENDSTVIKQELKNGKYITNGVQFKISESRIIGYIRGEGVLTTRDVHSRFYYSLQPEVIAFIKGNKERLNPRFREQAKQRRIIN